jgi:hypothetical protein
VGVSPHIPRISSSPLKPGRVKTSLRPVHDPKLAVIDRVIAHNKVIRIEILVAEYERLRVVESAGIVRKV